MDHSPFPGTSPPPAAPASLTSTAPCVRDAECVITDWGGCCARCPADPRATSRAALHERHEVCNRVRCARDEQACAPTVDPSAYRAVCRAGRCGGVAR